MSAAATANTAVLDYITKCEAAHPQFKQFWTNIRHNIQKRLWHQFTTEIQSLLSNDDFKSQNALTLESIFTELAQPLFAAIDPYTYVTFALQVCNTFPKGEGYTRQFKLLSSVKAQLPADEFDAQTLVDSATAYYYVQNDQIFKAMDLLINVESRIDSTSQIVSNLTHFQLHKAYAMVEQKRGQYLQEFSRKLLMLSFAEPEDVTFAAIADFSIDNQSTIAREIAISALLSDQVYNFGEVLAHATVKQHTPAPLKAMLETFQQGTLSAFDAQVKSNTQYFAGKEAQLYRKLQVVALLNFVFAKPAPERTFDWSALIPVTGAKDEMDMCRIVMYAFGAGVIRGQIDGIGKSVAFTWVQPRLLDGEQLKSLKMSIDSSVKHTADVIVSVYDALNESNADVAAVAQAAQ